MFAPAMSKPCCKNPKNLFCFVCGLYIPSHHKRSIMTRPLLEAYEAHFKVRTSKENYLHGPPSVCNVCNNALLRWKNGMSPQPELPFAIPMLWSSPTDHETDCYFCLTRTAPLSDKKGARSLSNMPVEYPTLRSAVRPKLFATRPAIVSQQPQIRNNTALAVAKEKDDSSMNVIRTYPGHIKLREPVNEMQVVRRSLPVQNIVSSVQKNPTVVSTSTLKRKVDSDVCVTYGVTKVRLRNSEPTIVLEKCKKLLPSNSSAIISRPATPSSLNAPRILNVFSLNKDAANCETNPPTSSPPNVPPQATIKMEVVDDEAKPTPNKIIKIQPFNGELLKVEPKQQVKELTIVQPTQQISTMKLIKVEPPSSSPSDTPMLQPIRSVRPYNGNDLSPANKVERTIKITPSIIAKKSADLAVSLKMFQATSGATQPSKVIPEQQQKTPQIIPAKYCFINVKDLPTASSSNDKTIKIISPNISQQSTVADQSPLNVTPATVSPGGSKATLEQDDIPHRITQSELILLLRELELPKEKSAVLIDRLKRWNLLAIEMVGTNRIRSLEPTTAQQPVADKPPSPGSSSSSSTPPPPPPPPSSSQAQDQPPQASEPVATLSNMKIIQIRNTRATNRQSAPPIITSNTANRTKLSPVSKQDNGEKSNSSVAVVMKGDQTWQQRRQTTVVAVEKETATVPQRGTITTRSAANAMVKQNVTSPKS